MHAQFLMPALHVNSRIGSIFPQLIQVQKSGPYSCALPGSGTEHQSRYLYCCRAILAKTKGVIAIHNPNIPCREGLLKQTLAVDSNVAHLLQACTDTEALKQVHARAFRNGLQHNIYLETRLVSTYATGGCMEDARLVFDQISRPIVFLWNVMIREYVRNGQCEKALKMYCRMHRAAAEPDKFTFPFVLKACAALSDLRKGEEVHDHTVRTGLEWDVHVATALIDMYAKCGRADAARQVFDKMPDRNVVSWNAMIAGCDHNGLANEALWFFSQMQAAYVKANAITMASVLPACAHLAALQQGKSIHGWITRNEFEPDAVLGTALLNMYSKCGNMVIARQLFDKMSQRDVVLWSAMIAGYGMHGYGEEALALFSQMQQAGTEPNAATFLSVLSACSHAGLVEGGWQCFDCMIQDYCITPRVEHYACMVDLLGRTGHLDEAQEFIRKMPLEPSTIIWGSLLAACRSHCNVEIGEHVAKCLLALKPENVGCYVLLSNIYAAAGRWDKAAKVRTMMKDKGLKKTPGCSWIEVNNRVHTFHVGDSSHPQSGKIYAMLETLIGQMKAAGYVPNTDFVLHDIEE